MPRKRFSFRFDVDTHACIRRGMPALVDLGSRLGARFTFFLNMGKAVSRSDSILERLSLQDLPSELRPAKLSSMARLGLGDWLLILFFNPEVGRACPELLRRARDAGHELALHGGRNHASWQRHASGWGLERLREELAWSLGEFRKIGLAMPAGFASPGWRRPPQLDQVLGELGFRYIADAHGLGLREVLAPDPRGASKLFEVPTNILGEPGGVGYLESLATRGLDEAAAVEDFRERLLACGDLAVAYDHPCWAGTVGLGLVGRMVETARECGYELATLVELASEAAKT